jgi:AbrB family looped-hinge helix DNA binding protein
MKSRVAERGQVTIPKRLRERLGIQPGTILAFDEENGRLVAVKEKNSDPVSKVFGCLKETLETDAVMAILRGNHDHGV